MKAASNKESLLINGLNKGNHDSFRQIFEIYASDLYSFSMKYVKSKGVAEEIVQDTFIKLWDKREAVKTEGSFRSLLITIALNSIRKHFNLLARENDIKDELLVALTEESEEYNEDDNYNELVNKLQGLIDQLPPRRKEVFHKKKILGMKAKEIALELDITVKTVEYHVAEAMRFLKKEFGSIGADNIILLSLLLHLKQKEMQFPFLLDG